VLLQLVRGLGLLDKSPFPRRVMPRIQERPPDRLTEKEVEAVLSVPEPHLWVVRLARGGLATGLRLGRADEGAGGGRGPGDGSWCTGRSREG
jgi:integrase